MSVCCSNYCSYFLNPCLGLLYIVELTSSKLLPFGFLSHLTLTLGLVTFLFPNYYSSIFRVSVFICSHLCNLLITTPKLLVAIVNTTAVCTYYGLVIYNLHLLIKTYQVMLTELYGIICCIARINWEFEKLPNVQKKLFLQQFNIPH